MVNFAKRLAKEMTKHSLYYWVVCLFPNISNTIEIQKRNKLNEVLDAFTLFKTDKGNLKAKYDYEIIDIDPKDNISSVATQIFHTFFVFGG